MKKLLIILSVCSLALFACNKNDLFYYTGEYSGLNLWLGNKNYPVDSVTYNFAYTVTGRDSIMFQYRIAGSATDYDRTFELYPAEGDSIRVYYAFGEYVIKAGEYEGEFPLYIDKPEGFDQFEDHDDDTGYMVFKMKPNRYFEEGAMEKSELRISFRNSITKPDNWDVDPYPYSPLSTYFGTYSDVKFAFIIQVTGLTDFKVTTVVSMAEEGAILTTFEVGNMVQKCKVALAAYEEEYGELYDENQIRVTF